MVNVSETPLVIYVNKMCMVKYGANEFHEFCSRKQVIIQSTFDSFVLCLSHSLTFSISIPLSLPLSLSVIQAYKAFVQSFTLVLSLSIVSLTICLVYNLKQTNTKMSNIISVNILSTHKTSRALTSYKRTHSMHAVIKANEKKSNQKPRDK